MPFDSSEGFCEEISDGGGDDIAVSLEGEVACVEEFDNGTGEIALEGFGAGGTKYGSFLPQIANGGGRDFLRYS
jgi:hypothetical protein